MMFHFGLKSTSLLLFFIHGIVFSGILIGRGRILGVQASTWLGLFLLLCSLYIAPFMLGYAGWYSGGLTRDLLFYIPFQQLFLLPPILYFYFRSLLDRSFVLKRKHFIHFIPAIAYLLYSAIVVLADKLVFGYAYFYQDGKDKDLAPWYQMAGFLSLLYYLVASWKVYRYYRSLTVQTLSFADSVRYRWAAHFLLAFFALCLLRGLFFILNPEWDEFGRKFWYYLSFSILFYYISISGLVNTRYQRCILLSF
ncbi:hypothetical protein [Cesiribacter andamanensis]|uniref:Uncharacterized protein n=1 Tax=Cesiribacter andamanensis AMV16 TaxID=1279009 RepID=M7N137_9BACT|nr:hypothetical protein [Cesiribacter andamanensis]EMR01017.1 hypothetical protein ADICEAN_03866 [Cesiribacter andamanensis AMV16]